jgi:hypothetical protein
MFRARDYRETAAANKEVLRSILEDMKSNRRDRELGRLIPEALEATLNTEDLFNKYSAGPRRGMFTILNFQRPDDKTAVISFQDVSCLSGGGANLVYEVAEDGKIKYKGSAGSWMS